MEQDLWLLLLGLLVGTVGTLIGAGGGFVLMPVLLLAYPEASTQTITSYAVNATVGAATWTGNGSGSIASFTGAAGINLSGNCTGCAGGGSPTTKGTANGAFVGAAAERMITSFGLNKGNQAIAGAAYLSR